MLGLYRFLRVIGLLSSTALFVHAFSVAALAAHAAQATLNPSYNSSLRQQFRDIGLRYLLSAHLKNPPDRDPQSPEQPSTRFEHILSRIKNNPLLAALLVLGTIIIALATFTDALKNLVDLIMHNRPEVARTKLSRMSLKFDPQDFVESVKRNDLHAVKTFLAARMNPNVKGRDGLTALMWAVHGSDTDIIHALLKANANVNEVSYGSSSGQTALDFALPDKKDVLRLLLRKGANADTVNNAFVTAARDTDIEGLRMLLAKGAQVTKVGTEALIEAAGPYGCGNKDDQVGDTVLFLLELGLDPKARNERWTALLRAACYGYKSAVQVLLDRGADINAICHEDGNMREGWTALMLAIDNEHYEIAQLLLEKQADINIRNDSGATALIIAANASSSRPEILPIIKILLDKGANVDAQNLHGITALINAADRERADLVRALVERGAAVNKKDEKGRTALQFAANSGDPGMALALLDQGADVNTQDRLGMTSLMRAAKSGRVDVLSLLLERGASVNKTDVNGKTALQFAQELSDPYKKAEITRVLSVAGAK